MKSSVARIIYYSILVALLLIALIVGILLYTFQNNRRLQKRSVDVSTETTEFTDYSDSTHHFDPQQIRSVDIDWTSGSIILEVGETQELVLTETGSEPMSVKLDGDTLKLQYPKNSGPSLGNHSKDLRILAPKDWDCRKLTVDTVSASLRVQDGTIRDTRFSTTSGTSHFENCTLDKFSVETVSGSVVFSGTLSDFEMESTSASAELDICNCPDSIELNSISGSMTLNLPSDCGFTVTHDSISGGFHSDFASTTHGSKQIHGGGECDINFEGVSASLTIHDRGENSHHTSEHHS